MYQSLLDQGRYVEAIPLIESALARDGGQGATHFALGFALHLAGKDAGLARHHYQRAAEKGFDEFRVFLNRGVLHAETGSLGDALEDFRRARALRPDDPVAARFLHQTEHREEDPRHLYYAPPHLPHLDAEWLETCSIPQSMQFQVDCLPAIRRLLAGWPAGRPVEVLDVGTASGAGAALLARLYRGDFFGHRMNVEAMDVIRRYRAYAERVFPEIHYIAGDLFTHEPRKQWDLVLCSHTIEHLSDPLPLIDEARRRARHAALFYAPFEERALIPGHLVSISGEFVRGLRPRWMEVIGSPAWRHPVDALSRCVVFVL
jgi:SAM-dependent methyltransferase